MKGRVWRTLAIAWFDAMNEEIGRYFIRSFLAEMHRVLNLGTEEELHDLRYSCELQRKQVEEILQTRDEERIFGGDWGFVTRYETFFVALCDLALEDFR